MNCAKLANRIYSVLDYNAGLIHSHISNYNGYFTMKVINSYIFITISQKETNNIKQTIIMIC